GRGSHRSSPEANWRLWSMTQDTSIVPAPTSPGRFRGTLSVPHFVDSPDYRHFTVPATRCRPWGDPRGGLKARSSRCREVSWVIPHSGSHALSMGGSVCGGWQLRSIEVMVEAAKRWQRCALGRPPG